MKRQIRGGQRSNVKDDLRPAIQKPLVVHFNGQTERVHWKPGERVTVQFGNFHVDLEFPEGEQSGPNLNGPWYWIVRYTLGGKELTDRIRSTDRENAERILKRGYGPVADRIKILEIERE